MNFSNREDTICALATAPGMAALAVIRISGPKSFSIIEEIFTSIKGKKKDFEKIKPYSLHFGKIIDQDQIIDEILVSVFKGPHSYTGEDTIEISCHGSTYIQQSILQLLIRCGARMADPGEFTLRAFLNGKLDLSQAEAVSDLISSQHASAHKVALQQLRGGYSDTMQHLRQQLVDFASLIELELDFAEEDVEFANREKLTSLVQGLLIEIRRLQKSFIDGNVLKSGVSVLIAGKPNVGKSTLLNALLNEERAIVSDIAGTTRDVIEDYLVIDGIQFRFMDTAGIRHSEDVIEQMGVERTHQHASKAAVIVYVADPVQSDVAEIESEIKELQLRSGNNDAPVVTVINKSDQYAFEKLLKQYETLPSLVILSAKEKLHIETLKAKLAGAAMISTDQAGQTIVTSARHAESLHLAAVALEKVIAGIQQNLSTDLLAFELKDSIYHLGMITGQIYTDDLLENIFSKFCIGK
jgi:tRNA modification GTPase